MTEYEQIAELLEGRNASIVKVGKFWQISLGARSGARVDGVSLARDLLAERDVHVPEPKAPNASEAVLASLEAARDKLTAARVDEALDPVPVPAPPASIADLFQPDRPFAPQAQALWVIYNDLTNKIQMAIATPEERAKHSRLAGELDWIRRHAFEAV